MGDIRIIAYPDDKFVNRAGAGSILADNLRQFSDRNPVILGIPRGGVIVAIEVALGLNAELDIVLSHKLSAPDNPELAIGAVCESQEVAVDKQLAIATGADQVYIQKEKERQLKEIYRRSRIYRQILPKIDLRERTVIVIDDGVATSATMQAALMSVDHEKPGKVIAAFPVGAKESLVRLAGYTDGVLCLKAPEYFVAVGQFYSDFPQVTDKEVVRELTRYNKTSGINQ